ncbi:aminopeptidase C [Thraustotheca clavata]|uniref:Aminopeptidase C n=1 Tax=Thraustotheca clavata TaxID=74557 RepID=A0A1V9ZLS1_9STRA|nr:aminopeptidase C [Thraustotheca clavata]
MKLRDFAAELRRQYHQGVKIDELRKAKLKMVEIYHRILTIFLGSPPTQFDFEAHDKDEKFAGVLNCTPLSFAREVIPIDLNDYVSMVNDPRNDYEATLTVDRLGNVVEGKAIRYLNLPIEHLWKYAKAQLDADLPVWFGCDCDADSELDRYGIYSKKLYSMEAVFGTTFNMNKKERMEYQNGSMTHAMVFTGYNALPGDPKPTKWKVENSWGKKRGEAGYDIMTADWFDEHMYQVVILKKLLSPTHARIWEQGEPIILPVWDPMGNCL